MIRFSLIACVFIACLCALGCPVRSVSNKSSEKSQQESQDAAKNIKDIASNTPSSNNESSEVVRSANTATVLPSAPASNSIVNTVEEAKLFFDRLTEDFPSDFDAFDTRARYYFFLGEHETAKKCWEVALKLNAQDAYSHNGLGLIYQAANDFESALGSFQQAYKNKPNDPTLLIHMAKSLLKLGRLDETIQVARECTHSHADSVEAWELLGQSCMAKQEYEQAHQAYSEAARRAPQSFIAQQGMAAALIRLNRRDEASKWLELQRESRAKLKTEQPQNQVAEVRNVSQHLALAANVFLKHKKSDLAIQTMQYAVACAPKEESPKQTLVDLYQKLGRLDEAISVAKDLVKQAPQRMGYRFGLADLYARKKDLNLTEQTLNETISLEPQNPQGYFSLLKLLLATGRNAPRQLELAQTLVKLRGNASDFAMLAQVLHTSSNSVGAIDAMKTALQKDPENSSYRTILRQLESKTSKP